MSLRWRRRAAVLLLGLAVWQLGQGGYIHAKAWLAQQLIAHSWSERLSSGAVVRPWPWADTVPVALLEVPRLGVRTWILADASGRSLAFGPGHVGGSASPGTAGSSLVAGHRDTHFRFLKHLQVSDEVRVQSVQGEWRRYRIDATAVLDTESGETVGMAEANELLLLTCYPLEALQPGGGQRYVVRAVEERLRETF